MYKRQRIALPNFVLLIKKSNNAVDIAVITNVAIVTYDMEIAPKWIVPDGIIFGNVNDAEPKIIKNKFCNK